jgi:phage terminase small subunit
LTFRTGKRHRVQEKGKSKSVLKLASKLQHFVDTGKASRSDLKEIDNQISLVASDQGRKILQLLEQLKEKTQKGRRSLEQTCADWSDWLAKLDSKHALGYSDVHVENGEGRSAILESLIDADTDIFRMLSAFSFSSASWLRKASYNTTDFKEIRESALDIMSAYHTRQRILSKLRS